MPLAANSDVRDHAVRLGDARNQFARLGIPLPEHTIGPAGENPRAIRRDGERKRMIGMRKRAAAKPGDRLRDRRRFGTECEGKQDYGRHFRIPGHNCSTLTDDSGERNKRFQIDGGSVKSAQPIAV